MFDERLYEDLFQQMVSETPKAGVAKAGAVVDATDFDIDEDSDVADSPPTGENNLVAMDSLNKINSQPVISHHESSQTHQLARFHSHDPSHHQPMLPHRDGKSALIRNFREFHKACPV